MAGIGIPASFRYTWDMKLLNPPAHEVKVSPSIIIFTTFFLIGLYFLFYVRSVIVMLFLSVIVVAALNPGVTKLQKNFKLSRVAGIITMYLLVILVLGIVGTFGVPPLVNQLKLLTKNVNLHPVTSYIDGFQLDLNEVNGLLTNIGGSVTTLISVVSSTFSGVFTIFTISVMSFYMLLDIDNLYKKTAWFSKDKRHLEIAKEFVSSVIYQLGGWVRGQLILMLVIGLVTYTGLSLMGVPYALPLALLAGLLEILPNLGPTIAAIPALIVAYFAGGGILLGVTFFFYIIIQQLENNLIVPKIMKDNVDVNPLATIVTILIGIQVGGVLGALLAVPAYIILRTIYSIWMRERGSL